VAKTPRFDAQYREVVERPDGRRLLLRAIRPEDKARFVEGMARLSPGTRFSRFFAAKTSFSEAELRYLTELDYRNHYAIGVGELLPDDTEGESVGVGRFVRFNDETSTAEPAIVVVDAWQGQGIGRLLLDRLIAAARERGIRYFRAECLAQNEAVKRLFERLGPSVRMRQRGSVVVTDIPLFDVKVDGPGRRGELPGIELLRMAAGRLIRFRPRS
jgi:RimJ/RimL family protein N-acetyltransferase